MNSGLMDMPDVVKNLIILNVVVYIATVFLFPQVYDLFSLHFVLSDQFQPYQIATHMFMHSNAGFGHLFFNMFGLWMFGSVLERIWGPKRFLSFYIIAGLGSALLYSLVNYVEWNMVTSNMSIEQIDAIRGTFSSSSGINYDLYTDSNPKNVLKAVRIYFSQAVGASGAIFGILVAFGMLFPNTEIMLIFLPIPIKAKYFIPIYIVIELFLGVSNFSWDNVAHFAHLGGALFGFIMVKIWNKDRTRFY